MAQGHTGTNSKRPNQYVGGCYPTHLHRAKGCYVWDCEGNRYIDFVGGLGISTIGYNHPRVVEAVKRMAEQATSMPLPHPIEVEVAEMIREMIPCAERVRFLKTGSEACSAAIRIARAHTKTLPVYSEHYHGWHDPFTSLTEPAAGCVRHQHVYLDPKCGADIYITEPICLDVSKTRQKDLRDRRYEFPIVIFDEVVSGFRVPQYTASNWFQIDPDIICLGKGMASGYPLACVAGKAEVMNNPDYFVSSTYSGDAISLAACRATLTELKQRNLKDLFFYANRFMDRFNGIMGDLGVRIQGYGTRGMLDITQPNVQIFMEQACKAGLFFGKAFFYNFSHLESNVDESVLSLVSDIRHKMNQGCELEGRPPQEIFERA